MVYSSSKIVPANIRQSIENPLNLSTNSKSNFALRYSVATAINQKSFSGAAGVNGNVEEVSNAESEGSLAESLVPQSKKASCLRSVKTFIIAMITTLVILSALVISATWLSSFGPAIVSLSSTIRKNEFEEVQSYLERTVKEIVLVVNTAKSQMHEDDLSSPESIELSLFRFFKSESVTHGALAAAILIGNETGSLSIIQWGPIPAFVDIGPQYQKVYYCMSGLATDYCQRSASPNMVMPSFALDQLYVTAKSSPGNSLFTPSYNVGADLTFVTMMTSWLKPNSKTEIRNYMALSMELNRISRFLEDLVSNITSSTAFIIETQTDNLIAVNNQTVPLAYLASNQVDIIRRTGLTVQSSVHNTMAKEIYKTYPKLTSLTCNTYYYLTTSQDYITMYRFCSDYNIDWVISMSAPQWNYISPIIIALLAATGGSLIIIGISVLVGIVFSFKIVKPFKTLMTMFERVSNMDIDAALKDQESNKSYFSELDYVQTQFSEMLKKLKMYRAFIPSYLLAELEGNNEKEVIDKPTVNQSTNRSRMLTSTNFKSGMLSSIDMIKSQKSSLSKKSNQLVNNLFSLYLESKQVSFVALYLDGLDLWYKREDCKNVVNLLTLIYEQINTLSRTSGYNVGTFENDILTLSFNSTKETSAHVEKALTTVHVLQDKLTGIRKKMLDNSFTSQSSKKSDKQLSQCVENLKFRFAVTSQMVFCGNLGTTESKNFSIVSSARTNLEKILETCHRLDLKVVIPERIFEVSNKMYQTRFVDMKLLSADRFYQNSIFVKTDSLIDIHNIEDRIQPTTDVAEQEALYELGSSNKVSEDEWMYELQQKNQLLKWKKYQEACIEYFSERYENALKLFEEFMAETSNKETAESLKHSDNPPQLEPPLDKPALVLSRICKMKLGIL